MVDWKQTVLKASRALGDASITAKAERKRGRRARVAMVGQSTDSVDAEAEAYVRSVGGRLVDASADRLPRGITPCFTLIRSNVVNAYCAEGGQVFVTVALVNAMRSEAELAAVLAHELGHAMSRHGVQKRALETELRRAARGVLKKVGRGMPARMATSAGTTVITRAMSRLQEEEADRLGVEIMAAAGYDPAVMAEVLGRIAAEDRPPNLFERVVSTHPANAERAEQLGRRAKEAVVARAGGPTIKEELRQVQASLRRHEADRQRRMVILSCVLFCLLAPLVVSMRLLYLFEMLSWIFDLG